ncbi:MAG: hypothetical protein HY671_09490 [Chloroflexi bacterium]|nr:hypothetical protein [Chloroflexota bacterium]
MDKSHGREITRATQAMLAVAFALVMVVSFFLPAGHALADQPVSVANDLGARGTVLITSLADGQTWPATGMKIPVNVFYTIDGYGTHGSGEYWEVSVIGNLGDSPLWSDKKRVSGSQGEVSFTIDLSRYGSEIAPGQFTVKANLYANFGGAGSFPRTVAMHRISLNIVSGSKPSSGGAIPGKPPGGLPGGANPVTRPPPNSGNSDSDGASPIVPIAVAAGGAAAAGLVVKKIIDRVRKPKKRNKLRSKEDEIQVAGSTEEAEGRQKTQRIQDAARKIDEADRRQETIEALRSTDKGALKDREQLDRLNKIRNAVADDIRLSEFVNDAHKSIVDGHGHVDKEKLDKLEGLLKRWIVRDKLKVHMPDYTTSDAFYDTVRQGSGNIVIRGGAAYLSAGYSEMALNPISALSTMRQGIMDGKSSLRAVAEGFAQSSFELALGESGRLFKYAEPYLEKIRESRNLAKLADASPDLASEVSTINQLARQSDDLGKYSRDAFIKRTDVVQLGKTAPARLDDLERAALNLNNNPEFRQLLSKNPDLVPGRVKDIMGSARQKAYQQARDNAIGDVINQMSKDGVPVGDNPFFINQTGTHARPGNPGWNPVKSDFDHTVNFGEKYNKLYEQRLNTHLESQGTSASALDVNVYGPGTSARGSYTGGATKIVENYNQTTGSDVMIRIRDGVPTISRETPQTSTSLLSTVKPADLPSARSNLQSFFGKSLDKGGSVENMLQNSSKEVSRMSALDRVAYFQKTGRTDYVAPEAVQVAHMVKNWGLSVDDAIHEAGYSGSKMQLLSDYKKYMGL